MPRRTLSKHSSPSAPSPRPSTHSPTRPPPTSPPTRPKPSHSQRRLPQSLQRKQSTRSVLEQLNKNLLFHAVNKNFYLRLKNFGDFEIHQTIHHQFAEKIIILIKRQTNENHKCSSTFLDSPPASPDWLISGDLGVLRPNVIFCAFLYF